MSSKRLNVSQSTFDYEVNRRKEEKHKRKVKVQEFNNKYKTRIKECYYVKRKGKRPRPLMLMDRRWHYGEFVYGEYRKDFKRYTKAYRMNIECVFIDNNDTVVIPNNYDTPIVKDPANGIYIQKGILIQRLFFPDAISFLFANGIQGDYKYKNLIPITEDDIENGDYAYLNDDILISKTGKVFSTSMFKYLEPFKPTIDWGDDNEYYTISENGFKVTKSLRELYKEAFKIEFSQ